MVWVLLAGPGGYVGDMCGMMGDWLEVGEGLGGMRWREEKGRGEKRRKEKRRGRGGESCGWDFVTCVSLGADVLLRMDLLF